VECKIRATHSAENNYRLVAGEISSMHGEILVASPLREETIPEKSVCERIIFSWILEKWV
jgi:hypothetical protein